MKKLFNRFSLVLTVMLIGFGCSSDGVVENKQFKDARSLVDSLASYSETNKAKDSQTQSLGESSGFAVADDYNFSHPMVLDNEGNLEKGGIFRFVNKEGHDVELEAQDENVVLIKVDLNGDGQFSEDEIITDKFKPVQITPPHGGSIASSIFGDALKAKLDAVEGSANYVADDEKILVEISLFEPDFIYPVEIQTVNATGGASVDGNGNVTYFYNGKEVSKEQMQLIQKRYEANQKRRNLYRAKVIRDDIEEFLLANNIAKNDSIKHSIEEGIRRFQLSLTKQEIKDLANANKDWISAIDLFIPPSDEAS